MGPGKKGLGCGGWPGAGVCRGLASIFGQSVIGLGTLIVLPTLFKCFGVVIMCFLYFNIASLLSPALLCTSLAGTGQFLALAAFCRQESHTQLQLQLCRRYGPIYLARKIVLLNTEFVACGGRVCPHALITQLGGVGYRHLRVTPAPNPRSARQLKPRMRQREK